MARSIAHPTVEVTLLEEADSVRLLVSGDLDPGNAWALTAAVIRSEVTQPSRLVVDLGQLEFIDVGGLRAISDAARRARRPELTGRWTWSSPPGSSAITQPSDRPS